jgi:hypothetical protein
VDAVRFDASCVVDVLAHKDHAGLDVTAPKDRRLTQDTALRMLHMDSAALRHEVLAL